ncbi:hypothetical protein N0X72_26815 [Streptomyces carpaticus]|uniref:hypothetical protein n=1 Tax=Streptomyces TaxID=1883 RepID=UPI00220A5174|nr:hypothetical protein N0X72_26815 [Streptomyces carpaticus]
MPERHSEAEFAEKLRRAAEVESGAGAAEPGPVPVDDLIRRGRALRFRRRAAVVGSAGAVGVLAVVLAAGPLWWPGGGAPGDERVPPAATGGASPAPSARDGAGGPPVEVEPYERVVISDTLVLALLPEGRQNFLLSSPEHFEENLEIAAGLEGDNIRPDSVSAGYDFDTDPLVYGAWRLEGTPSRIVVVPEDGDEEYPATLVMLTGEPGWGVYYLDAASIPSLAGGFRVVAYDADGEVFADLPVAMPW